MGPADVDGRVLDSHPMLKDVMAALAAPFDPVEVKFKPQVVQGNRALAIGYVDARVIQDRLDDALGGVNWQDEYELLPDGSVLCRLKLRLNGEWITKMDVGGQSEQPDGGDRMKAAFSDALKRAAIKFGVGRYLYRMQSQWYAYDPQKRQFVDKPSLAPAAVSRAVARTVKPEPAAEPEPKQLPPPAADKQPADKQPKKAKAEGPAPARASVEQVDAIDALCLELKHDAKWLETNLDKVFCVKTLAELNDKQAAQVIAGLQKEKAKKAGTATAATKPTTPANGAAKAAGNGF